MRKICLDLCMATSTGMEYWMDLDIEELLAHQRDVDELIQQSRSK